MPKIDPNLLRSVCFIYPSRKDAERGSRFGGSGFFTCTNCYDDEGKMRHYYIVTNKHVINQSRVVRLETTDGKNDFLETKESDWIRSKTDDLAVLRFVPSEKHTFHPLTEFLHQVEISNAWGFGSGDEVFMIGRFVTHKGIQLNNPTVRFGNLSVIETIPIFNESCNQEQESLIVEARSIKGYSGSPVFIWKWPWKHNPDKDVIESREYGGRLLGINWGYNTLPIETEILDKQTGKPTGKTLLQLYPNSGMMNVIPAWKLEDLLNSPEVKMQEKQSEEEGRKNKWGRAEPASNIPPKSFTHDDFMRELLARAHYGEFEGLQ